MSNFIIYFAIHIKASINWHILNFSSRVIANMRTTTEVDIVHQILKRNFSGAYAIPFRRAKLLLRTPVLVEKGLPVFHIMKQPLGNYQT